MRSIFVFILMLVLVSGAVAQDIHFSQFYNVPLATNPALTGRMSGSYRIGVVYRNQWPFSVNGKSSFATPGLFVDVPIRLGKKKTDILGVGGFVYNDRAAQGMLTNLTFLASAAYTKVLGSSKNHGLSIGVQAGYAQRMLDTDGLLFGSQIDPDFTNPNPVPLSPTPISDDKAGAFDLNLGLMWSSFLADRVNIYFGGAMYHLLEPKMSFIGDNEASLPRRYIAHGGLDVRLSDKLNLMPSLLYQRQVTASEMNFGLSAGIGFSEKTSLFLGAYYRLSDAVIPYVGVEFFRCKVGLTYDTNLSDLNNSNGAAEITLSYMGKYIETPTATPAMYCPRF